MTLFLFYLLLLDIYGVVTSAGLLGFKVSALVVDITALSIRIQLFLKREDIVASMNSVMESIEDIGEEDCGGYRVSRAIGSIVSCVFPVALLSRVFTVCLSMENVLTFQRNFGFGWQSHSTSGIVLVSVYYTSIVLQLFILPGFSIVLCCFQCMCLQIACQNLSRRIKSREDLGSVYEDTATLLPRITRHVRHVRDSMSVLLFLVYAFMLSYVFSLTTFFVQIATLKMKIHVIDLIMFELTEFILVILAFFGLSTKASDVHVAAKEVTRVAHERCSRESSRPSDGHRHCNWKLRSLILTRANNFAEEIVLDGWDFFKLTRSFILRTVGCVFTYGVILAQLGR